MTTTTNTTKNYELTILVDEIAPQEVIDGLTEKIKGYGKITSIEDDGVKRLAYPIRNHEKARYLFYTLELENDVPAELSRNLGIEDNVIRYLLVRA
jgi:small subunit ribosomal protein S6